MLSWHNYPSCDNLAIKLKSMELEQNMSGCYLQTEWRDNNFKREISPGKLSDHLLYGF